MEIKKITKCLVANRGEIAIRIFRAGSELNIRTVAIYTWEDRYSLHRYKADEAYQIGEKDDPLKPYLDMDEIIRVAKENDVDAIHPGYGFLSENASFADKCKENGIIWVGPPAGAMRKLGDKVSAKRIAVQNNIPVIEASQDALDNEQDVINSAHDIGLPVMIKAAVGGGGRGMRVIKEEDQLSKGYLEASREASTAFGHPEVFVEKYVDNPKHIEVQVLADQYGNTVHLFERDCSIQRRFQKVVEIAPALTLKQSTKEKLYQYAVTICKSSGYANAGTVEFLIDKDENIYFIEVNTRIQVEHTITEVITGIDLVKSQLLIAMGYPLDHELLNIGDQDNIQYRGCAIQCRITTEDPSNGFKPDYGRLIAYRSAGGFGIRLDAGNAFAGAIISPFFDSLLVKVTSWGHTLDEAADRLHRALREWRIRGVKSNIPFLLNILQEEAFRKGDITVNYIANNPHLMKPPQWKDRGTKMLRYIGNVIVNGNPNVKTDGHSPVFIPATVPKKHPEGYRPGTKQLLTEKGPLGIVEMLKNKKEVMFTDTTYRDAHQSLLATRVRTHDMVNAAGSYASHFGDKLFSMEVWGGATFDVSMRFLRESPWERLRKLRKACPNVLLQMLLRGSNAVGYKAYPDNVIESFIMKAWEDGIDVFRIFDSLNWVEAMKTSINTIANKTNAIAEVSICYTGDVLRKNDNRFDINYYLEMVKEIEDAGAHIIAIKDMAGLLKPEAANYLISSIKDITELPIHLHTHDTSSIQSTTYMEAIKAGVDVVDVAISSMSGITSQPNFNSIVAMSEELKATSGINVDVLNKFSDYWEEVRRYYYAFETELKSGSAEVYTHEIPGGQYSNLRPQARGLGLEEKFDIIKDNYKKVNDLLGGIVKVTPSSKVVGDMALFMTSNDMTIDDIIKNGENISFPDSMVSLMRGDLGQWKFGWPKNFQKAVLKGEKPFAKRPNEYLEPIDLDKGYLDFKEKYPEKSTFEGYLSYLLYPKVFDDYYNHVLIYGETSQLPTTTFFYGLKPHEEISVEIARGKTMLIEYLNTNAPDEYGNRLVIFRLNGAIRSVMVKDNNQLGVKVSNQKTSLPEHIGSPLQGSLSKILVSQGEEVIKNQALCIIEAMKMETTIVAPYDGKITGIHLKEKTMVEQNDLIISCVKS
jgi:pyruvate carboxylase